MDVETLGDAFTYGATAWMSCAYGPYQGLKRKRECNYRVELCMETLLCTRGRAFPISKLGQCLRCPRCGSRDVRVLLRFPSDSKEGRGAVGWG